MLIEPSDDDFGMLGGCDATGETAAGVAGLSGGGYMALQGDRPMFGVYLGVSEAH
jgi:hypothetical protein